MRTTILTQKKFSVNLKECRDINTFMSELTLLIKTLREQKDKGYNLVQAQVDGLRQSLEIAITTSKEGKAGATKSLGQGDQKQGQQGQQQQQQQQKKRFSLGRGNQQQQPPKPQ